MVKTLHLSLVSLSLTALTAWGNIPETGQIMNAGSVMKALPIYSNTLIDKAPEGETVTGIRNCYSSMMMGGDSYRDFEYGVVGEYVLGTDNNVYLRKVCYKAGIDTYLKLEKVDETTYVAHTPQLIWVDELSDGSLFTAYATRVVFSQKSATSFGYELQQTPDGNYDTDIYFTLKDGTLRQVNMNTTEMNEEIFPEELIGFTTSTGGWIGFGDGCIEITQASEKPVVLPEGVNVQQKSLDFNVLHVRDIPIDNAVLINYAEQGDDIYISNPSSNEQWMKGSIDRNAGTATFRSQFIGIDKESGYAIWFIPATYDKYIEVFDDETGYGDWFRTYKSADALVFSYADGVLTAPEGYAMLFSHDNEQILVTGVSADPSIREYKQQSTTPSPVTFTKYEPFDDLWGFGVMGFGIPARDIEGCYIPTDELYYCIYPDDSTSPYIFSAEDYQDMQVEPMTDVPYNYFEDFDFKVNGANHTVYFYHDWQKVGVQVIQKHNGVETRSAIVYSDGSGSGIENVTENLQANKNLKYFENGQMIILHNGVKYNAQGIEIK